MKSEPYLSVIIPAYDEEKRIGKTLGRVQEWLTRQRFSYEVIVVIDGARDHTTAVCRQFQKKMPCLSLIERPKCLGKGHAVKEGMMAAKGHIRLFTDADSSTDIGYFSQMVAYFEQGYDVVISSREPKDAPGAKQETPQSFVKRLLGKLGNRVIQIMVLPGIWDTQNGFKAFTRQAAQDIFPRLTINRWGFDVEALALARKFHFKIAKIGVLWHNDPQSHVKRLDYLGALWEVLLIRIRLWKNRYG